MKLTQKETELVRSILALLLISKSFDKEELLKSYRKEIKKLWGKLEKAE